MQISISNLHKSYFKNGSEIKVLQGIDLEVASGEFISLTGASGVGKSTLLQVLGTLDSPTSGEVQYDGTKASESSEASAYFRNKNIGFVFQFHHLLPEMTALENTMMPLLIRRCPWAEARELASNMLRQVGLSERLTHKPSELSGGEQQRVALARALINEPKLLLADEPTGNLDEETGEAIFSLIQNLCAKRGVTVLFVTHHTGLASRAQRHLNLVSGKL